MSTTESLRLQLENRRLRNCAQHPHSEGEDPASAQQLRELYEQKADLQRWRERQELDRYWALGAQREKWEERDP